MPSPSRSLEDYQRKRDFSRTREPSGRKRASEEPKFPGRTFVVQKHKARQLHYDFRLELDGVLKSWAVAKGPSLVEGEKRLAVHVEDHPLEYGKFEGTIPEGQYGAGSVIVWDRGIWASKDDPVAGYAKGHLSFSLHGEKLKGGWHLVRIRGKRRQQRDNWLLIKAGDEFARSADGPGILDEAPQSVLSGKEIETIAKDPLSRQWTSSPDAKQPASTSSRLTPRQRAREPLLQSEAKAVRKSERRAKAVKLLRIQLPEGARKGAIPGFVEPCLATAAREPPRGTKWIHEVKFDGYRLLAVLNKGKITLRTRSNLDWTAKFPSIAGALRSVPVANAIFDGEAVVEDKNGISDFVALQQALKANKTESVIFYVFDLLHLNGHSLQNVPLIKRKAVLENVIAAANDIGKLRFSAHFECRDAEKLMNLLCRLSAEGLISKRIEKPYHGGRSLDWLKIKCANRQEFVVVGYVPSTTVPKAIGSIVLGVYDQNKLMHAGRAGTGFSLKAAQELFTNFKKIERQQPAVYGPVSAQAKRDVRWVEPTFVVEVEFRGWTANNMVRQAAFKGLREDKASTKIIREPAATAVEGFTEKTERRTEVKLSHPDRLLWPESGVTKQALAEYYARVWSLAAPHLIGRPLALVRCPNGVDQGCFFQKHLWQGKTKHIVPVNDQKDNEILVSIADFDGLIELVQASVVEIHPWGSTSKKLETPDRLVFDLDPGENIGWSDIVAAAKDIRARLRDDKLESFAKTSGGKGLHVIVPIAPRANWDEAKAYSREVAQAMAAHNPARLTAAMSKRERKGRIYVDYLRNSRGSTAVAPYSTRARPEGAISMPLEWDEIDAVSAADHFTLANVGRRLRNLSVDPWREMPRLKQYLPAR